MKFAHLAFVLILLIYTRLANAETDWPQFRGPDAQGRVSHADVPLRWSESENVTWKAEIPGSGWSSPVVQGQEVWLTTATDNGRSLRAICVDRQHGKIRHNIEVFQRGAVEHVHSQNSHATPTPVIDGERVIVHFGANGTAALTRNGLVLWRNTELAYQTPHGSANSPVVHDDFVILCCDGTDQQFVAALDKHTGKTVWRKQRAHLEDAHRKSREEQNKSRKGLPFIAFSTPLIVDVDSTPLLISTPADHVVANRVADGEEVWWLPYNCFSLVARPVEADGVVYAIGGLQDGHYAMYAIRTTALGKVEGDELLWKRTQSIPQCPSPIVLDELLFFIKDSGIATCVNAQSGAQLWQQRIPGNYRSSPIAVGKRIYVTNQAGKTTVFNLGKDFEPLATNQLDGLFLASPAVAGDSLFFRSQTHLYRMDQH